MYKTTCDPATEPTIFRMYIEAALPRQRAVCSQCGKEIYEILMSDSTVLDYLFHVQVGKTKRCLCLGCLLKQMQDESLYRYPFRLKQ